MSWQSDPDDPRDNLSAQIERLRTTFAGGRAVTTFIELTDMSGDKQLVNVDWIYLVNKLTDTSVRIFHPISHTSEEPGSYIDSTDFQISYDELRTRLILAGCKVM